MSRMDPDGKPEELLVESTMVGYLDQLSDLVQGLYVMATHCGVLAQLAESRKGVLVGLAYFLNEIFHLRCNNVAL